MYFVCYSNETRSLLRPTLKAIPKAQCLDMVIAPISNQYFPSSMKESQSGADLPSGDGSLQLANTRH